MNDSIYPYRNQSPPGNGAVVSSSAERRFFQRYATVLMLTLLPLLVIMGCLTPSATAETDAVEPAELPLPLDITQSELMAAAEMEPPDTADAAQSDDFVLEEPFDRADIAISAIPSYETAAPPVVMATTTEPPEAASVTKADDAAHEEASNPVNTAMTVDIRPNAPTPPVAATPAVMAAISKPVAAAPVIPPEPATDMATATPPSNVITQPAAATAAIKPAVMAAATKAVAAEPVVPPKAVASTATATTPSNVITLPVAAKPVVMAAVAKAATAKPVTPTKPVTGTATAIAPSNAITPPAAAKPAVMAAVTKTAAAEPIAPSKPMADTATTTPPSNAATAPGAVASLAPSPTMMRFVSLGRVTFDFNKWKLTDRTKRALDEATAYIAAHPGAARILVNGHADWIGSIDYNDTLSDKRAVAVQHYLSSRGIDPTLIDWKGHGERAPIDENWTRLGRDRNRQVELFAVYPAPR